MDKYNRKVMFCDLRIKTNRQHILPDPLEVLLGILQSHIATSIALMQRNGGKVSYFISDVQVDLAKQTACVYINRHDENGRDRAFSERLASGTYQTTILAKTSAQGNATGAHLLFHLTPRNVAEGHSYYSAVEAADGLGLSISQALLRSVFKDISVSSPTSLMARRTTSTAKKPETYRPIFDLLGMPIDSINTDLAAGHGVDLRVVRSSPIGSLGRAASKYQAEEAVILKPTPNDSLPNTLQGVMDVFRAIPGVKKSGRFSFKHNGVQQPVHFKFEGENPILDQLLVQSNMVGPTSGQMADITPQGLVNSEFVVLLNNVLLDKISNLS